MINKRFGNYVVRGGGVIIRNKKRRILLLCLCDCGNLRIVRRDNLLSGHSKSCGCLRKENATKHKLSNHPLYFVWANMVHRCKNKENGSYESYGGRNISVCNEWVNSVETFYFWAVNNGFRKGLQIDRINNNGNYEPNNCRFATSGENQRNTRRSKVWFINDIKFNSISTAAKFFNVSYTTIRAWCNGYESKGSSYPSKNNCYSKLIYEMEG